MLKTVKMLVTADHNTTMGNHNVRISGDERRFTYHSTVICFVNDRMRVFSTDNGGWNTMSTNRAINDYRRYFLGLGYKDLNAEKE